MALPADAHLAEVVTFEFNIKQSTINISIWHTKACFPIGVAENFEPL